MTWNPNIHNVYQPIPTEHILRDGAQLLVSKKLVSFPQKQLRDSHGVYGLAYGHFILLARDYIYGFIISVHKDAVAEAIKRRIPLVIYIKDAKTFYKVEPEDVLKHKIDENQKGRAEMINFSVKICERWDI